MRFSVPSSSCSPQRPQLLYVSILEQTHVEHAESVVGFTERSTYEVIRQTKNPQLVAIALQGLSASVEELEVSHPKLVHLVNAISVLLSNIGI